MIETSISKPNGTLLLSHAIYEGKRKIEFNVIADYSFYMDHDAFMLAVNYNLSSIKSFPEDQNEDYRLLEIFLPELSKILWNKTADQLLGRNARSNYIT
jgi:hypothetical protein